MNRYVIILAFMLSSIWSFGQEFEVKGKVVEDGSQMPLPGVTVLLKNTSKGTSTDFDGNFSLKNVPGGSTIVFSSVGYATQEVVITSSKELTIVLKEDAEALESVVVIGYGSQRKELVSGAFSSVESEEILERNPVRVEEALQGSASGVQVNATSGSPGAALNIRIRGITSNGNNNPLIIVDGVNVGDDLSVIDPNDIEKLDVIKDASSAIYGVQASNGVILITTKSGRRESKTKFNYNSFYAVQETSNTLDLMNATEYGVYVNETEIADGNPLPYPNLSTLGVGTDWQDELFTTAPLFSHSLSASGGSENITYGISGGYLGQDGIIASEKSNFTRWTLKNNLSINLTEDLKLNTLLLYTNVKRRGIPEGGRGSILYYGANASPLTPIFDGTDGSGPSRGFSYIGSEQGIEIINPFAVINNTFNETKTNRFTGKLELQYEIIPDLQATSRFNFNYADVVNRFYIPLQYYGPNKVQNTVNVTNNQFVLDTNDDGDRDVYSLVGENVQNFFDYTWESFINYKKSFGDHNFDGLLGTSLQSFQYDGFFATGFLVNGPDEWSNAYLSNTQSFIIDDDDTPNGDPNDIQQTLSPTTGIGEDRLYSIFGRVQYDYQGKYLFSAMLRRDASTRFGPNNRVGYFPSLSGGWIVSQEEFFKSSIIDNLKLRGSWGITGNDRIGSYRWLGLLQGANAEATYPFGDVLSFGNAIGALSNPSLQWETTKQTNIGLDMSLFDRKLNVTVDYYKKRTEDLLLVPEVSALLGTSAGGSSAPVVNAGIVENRGLDLSINFSHDFSDDFSIQVGYNLTSIDNEAIEVNNAAGFLPGGLFDLNQTTSRFQSGLPIGAFWGLQTDGIFQNQAEIDAHAAQPGAQPGDIRYVDVDGDGVIEFGSEDDQTMIGNPIPDFTMGFNLNLNYKQFDFGTSLYASIGNDIARSYERFLTYSNKPTLYLDRWTGEGTSNSVPRASTNASNNRLFSDFFVEDGSYLRIQNIQIGYSLPSEILEKIHLDRFRLYFSVNNLYTFTKYRGYNPDVNNANPLAAGVDLGQYPLARTFTTGINVSF
ncbi:TonB-linked SusC/RagA family outer membrane protein [Kordia periserrulae]|uniref:TonB-linked SusC/RagA family outer membrane protein n=1 Tax=Kordia periserrulae TaxID=701523 RepID=A0A2T6BZQ9_9FLAO|nr:TonB-dependent receptor [Kordia periserrulae]PTX61554.1 TonB-linked SusC/RagA family outer membrane protein [Kordia periserrulae]